MADSKLTGLTEDTSPTGDDLLYTVNDPAGTPASRKVQLKNILPWKRVVRVVPSTTRTTTSGSYANFPATDTAQLASLVKKRADTNIVITVHVSGIYKTTTGDTAYFGVNFNSTDYDVASQFFNELSSNKSTSGAAEVSGVAAGTYTFTMRAKSAAGSINVDGSSSVTLVVEEVFPT